MAAHVQLFVQNSVLHISGFDKAFEFVTDLMNRYRDVDLTYANYLNDRGVGGLGDELAGIWFLKFPKFYANDINFSNFLTYTTYMDSVHLEISPKFPKNCLRIGSEFLKCVLNSLQISNF